MFASAVLRESQRIFDQTLSAPRTGIRELAWNYAPSARNKWEAQLIGYQHIPDDLLFHWQSVELTVPVKQIVGQTGKRVKCDICGEEIIGRSSTRGWFYANPARATHIFVSHPTPLHDSVRRYISP